MSERQEPQTAQTEYTAEVNQYHLEEYLRAVDAVVDECRLRITEDGFETNAVDPANVAMVRAELNSDVFHASGTGDFETGLPTYRLINLLERMDESVIGLEYDDERRKLDLTGGPYRYTLSCIDPESLREDPTIPDMDLGFTGDIKIGRLREAVEWFDEFTTHANFCYEPEDSRFYIEGLERDRSGSVKTDDGLFELARSELEYVREAGPAHSHFSLDYLRDIVNAVPDGRTVTLQVGEEFPMKLSYKIGWEETGPNEGYAHGEVTFMQAPRIASD
jgi:proliferating cell nuclear antigen